MDEFDENFEKEFSMMACLMISGFLACSSTDAWFLDSGASWHMTGMRSVFLSFTETDSGCYVGCGANTKHVLSIKGVGNVKFQLEIGGFLELVEALFIIDILVNFLLVLTFEVGGYGIVLIIEYMFLYLEGSILAMLGVRSERLYRLLEQPIIGSIEWLD